MRAILLVSCLYSVVAFQCGVSLKPLRSGLRSPATSVRMAADFNTKRMQLDRRSMLAASFFTLAGPSLTNAATDGEAAKIASGMLELSNQRPYVDQAIAYFSDGSPIYTAIEAAIKSLDATPVKIDPKKPLSDILKAYSEGNCMAAFVSVRAITDCSYTVFL